MSTARKFLTIQELGGAKLVARRVRAGVYPLLIKKIENRGVYADVVARCNRWTELARLNLRDNDELKKGRVPRAMLAERAQQLKVIARPWDEKWARGDVV